jgi:cytoskeletal protein RodZ
MEQTTGQKLREARIDRGLTLEEVSESLHIRVSYLEALESDALERIPSQPQARGFVRSYGKHLDLNIQDLLSEPEQKKTPRQSDEINKENPTEDSEVSYHLIFKEIGATLRQRRDVLGLSRDDIEAHTHIPIHYVDFIESGDFDKFPSPAQARGMLHNYLNFLEFKPDEIMNRYAEALMLRLSERRTQQSPSGKPNTVPRPRRKTPKAPQWVRMFLSPDLILITIVGVIVVGLTIWGIGRVTRAQSEQVPQPTAPSLVEALLPTSTLAPSASPTPQQSTGGDLQGVDVVDQPPTEIPTVQVAPGTTLEVFFIVRQRAYLQVTVDGTIAFDGRTSIGNNLTFTATDEIRILTGNAAALQVYFNDQDQGVIGIFGEVAELIFTSDGVIRPTKVPTATPEFTETPTATPEGAPTDEVDLPPEQNTPVP